MDIGTAKPSAAERARVPHHLIDLVDPDQPYSAGRFRTEAIETILQILERRRIPLLVGGTMLYFHALAAGLDELPPASPETRRLIEAQAAQRGWPALHAELAALDPQAARRITPNDAQRIQRALEVYRLTGRPISSLQRAAAAPLPFAIRGVCLVPERAGLHRAIEERFDAMLSAGLVDEVRRLRERYRLTADAPSMRAVGYRQVWALLEGEIDDAAMRSQAIAATRQLAKRQLAWLRRFPWLPRLETGEPRAAAQALFHSFL